MIAAYLSIQLCTNLLISQLNAIVFPTIALVLALGLAKQLSERGCVVVVAAMAIKWRHALPKSEVK